MNTTMSAEIREVLEAVHYRPAVSIILPFEPKMSLKSELMRSLKFAADKVELELQQNYPAELSQLVMHKLRTIFTTLNFNTHKKSIAIYVSPVFEKVLYLDILVEEKIIVNESFEIRDLVYSKKQLQKYLVLLLSGNESRMYLGNTDSFVRILTNTPSTIAEVENDAPEKVANFSDMSARKELLTDKFLHHIDNSLDIILNAYQLPLFVLGTERIMGHFKKLTKHGQSVVDYVHGNYLESTEHELWLLLQPHIADWKKVHQKDILNKLEAAVSAKKIAIGMKAVWHEAMQNRGKLLIVEKNYMFAAQHGGTDDVILKPDEPYNKYSYIKDAVDDVISKVLENGGDVEFVDKDLLTDYMHIALLQYY